jgi:hypothetical protein
MTPGHDYQEAGKVGTTSGFSFYLEGTSSFNSKEKKGDSERVSVARHQWLTPVILATQEADFRRIEV